MGEGLMKKAAIGLALIFLFMLPSTARAAPRVVSDWAALKLAVDSASPGDRIVIAGDLEADGEIEVYKDLTISGKGHALRPKSGYGGRALVVKNAAVTIEDTTFSGFNHTEGDAAAGGAVFAHGAALKLDRCVFSDNFADNSGGALYQYRGTLEVSNCAFVRNTARTSGGVSGFGGAVMNDGANAAIRDSDFLENRAGRYGGAVYATIRDSYADNEVAFAGCAFEKNEAAGGGGAVYVLGGLIPLNFDACSFTLNSAAGGGGAIAAHAQHTYVTGSAFTRNASDGKGPALLVLSGVLYLDANTFDNNARGDTYDYGEDVALAHGYGVSSLALTIEGRPLGAGMNIGQRGELFVGSESENAPFVIETEGEALALEDGGLARPVAGGYTAAFTGEAGGKARVTLREDRGKAYAVLSVIVNAVSDKCALTGFSFRGIRDAKADIRGQAVFVEVPEGTDVTRLIPEVEHEGASVSPACGVPTDFSSPVAFTVTAESGKTRAYTVEVRVKQAGLSITGIPDNLIVYAGGRYVLRASLPGGEWSYYALTASAEAEDGGLVLTPCNAGGGWVEYEVRTGGGTERLRVDYTVVPSLLPMTGQSRDGIALLMLCAALCAAALKAIPHRTGA
jgi:predicted outer membrane repeat protein